MSKYCDVLVKKAYDFASSEWRTDKEVCQYLGINRDTFYRWKRTKPDFAQAMDNARQELQETTIVEAKKALLKSLKGYYFYEKSEEGFVRADGTFEVTKVTISKKYHHPDVAAIIFACQRLEPERYSNKNVISGEVRIFDLEKISGLVIK